MFGPGSDIRLVTWMVGVVASAVVQVALPLPDMVVGVGVGDAFAGLMTSNDTALR